MVDEWSPCDTGPDGPGRFEVTVVIPVWDDYVAVVGDAVASVLAQDEQAHVLVVDNHSAQRLPRLPPRVRVERVGERLSAGAARNRGLALVQTEFTLFLDADDVMAPGALSLLSSRLKSRPDLSGCCCGVLAWNPRTGRVQALDFPSRRTRLLARWPGAYRAYAAMANRMPTTGCVLMRTELARGAGGFTDADFAEDWGLNVALAFRGPIEFLSYPGRLLRVHSGSLRSQPRSRDEVARAFAQTRARLARDPAAPALLRFAAPLLSLGHRRQLRRLTPGGVLAPGTALAEVGDGGALRTASPRHPASASSPTEWSSRARQGSPLVPSESL